MDPSRLETSLGEFPVGLRVCGAQWVLASHKLTSSGARWIQMRRGLPLRGKPKGWSPTLGLESYMVGILHHIYTKQPSVWNMFPTQILVCSEQGQRRRLGGAGWLVLAVHGDGSLTALCPREDEIRGPNMRLPEISAWPASMSALRHALLPKEVAQQTGGWALNVLIAGWAWTLLDVHGSGCQTLFHGPQLVERVSTPPPNGCQFSHGYIVVGDTGEGQLGLVSLSMTRMTDQGRVDSAINIETKTAFSRVIRRSGFACTLIVHAELVCKQPPWPDNSRVGSFFSERHDAEMECRHELKS